jgi:hypothetical protein
MRIQIRLIEFHSFGRTSGPILKCELFFPLKGICRFSQWKTIARIRAFEAVSFIEGQTSPLCPPLADFGRSDNDG